MRGLAVRPSAGLGGATVVARRPMSVADYRTASTITHDYDAPVLGEGIRSILAVPVVVDGRARAVLYGAYRRAAPIGDRTADLMVAPRGDWATSCASATRSTGVCACGRPSWRISPGPELRRSAKCMRSCAGSRRTLGPPALRAQLRVLAERLAREGPAPAVALSPRELDVLAQVALGCTNDEAAKRLSLKPETVKSYLRSATAKLGAHTRHEAVSKARRSRLLPYKIGAWPRSSRFASTFLTLTSTTCGPDSRARDGPSRSALTTGVRASRSTTHASWPILGPRIRLARS